MKEVWAQTISALCLAVTFSIVSVGPNEFEDSVEGFAQTIVPVSDGSSVTIYERTGDYVINTYSIETLTGGGGKFSTVANERYTITSGGTYLISDCYRPYSDGGGHNIAAARLNGVPGYPDGIWAGLVVSYVLGQDGIPETRFNSLGNHMKNHTRLGDENSRLVLAFLVETAPEEIEAELDCGPKTLNLGSMGNWITCYIELPEGYDPKDIDANSILMNEILSPELDPKYGFVVSEDSYVVDHDGDGILERMVKFDRSEVQKIAILSPQWRITMTGGLYDGTDFVGHDTIAIILHRAKPFAGMEWAEWSLRRGFCQG